MKTERGSSDGSFAGFLIVLTLLVVLVVVVIQGIIDGRQIAKFDTAVKTGGITIDAVLIPLGGSDHPNNTALPGFIPEENYQILLPPRLYKIEGCEGFSYRQPGEVKEGVYATTPFFQPELVDIIVPPQTSGTVNICVPQGTQIDVVVWAK